MSSQADAVAARRLAAMFRLRQQARPVLLVGAGASFSSGVPMAAECVRRMARRYYAERVAPGNLPPERIKVSEWQDWLRKQAWFIPGDNRLGENFPLVVQHLLKPQEYRREVFGDILALKAPIGPGYRRLAELMMRGLVRTVLTTNFDRCIPEAARLLGPIMRPLVEVNQNAGDLKQFDLYARAQIIWLHGTADHYTDRNLIRETTKLDEALVAILLPLIGSSPLVVMGYGGAEASITEHLLGDPGRASDFKRGIYWCIRHGEIPHPNVEALARKVGDNFEFIRIAGFDELMEGLAAELAGEDSYQDSLPKEASATGLSGLPYDDEPLAEASEADLDVDQMLATMIRYCQELGRAPVTRALMPALMAELGLMVQAEGRAVPTRGCMLLFGRDPQAFMPHAVTEATIAGKKRQLFSGNLLNQHQALLAWLDGKDVNPVLSVKAKTAHIDRRAIPELALVELAVNALVHRDYAIPEPVAIDATPDEGHVGFVSPGALPAGLAGRVSPDADGRFQPKEFGSYPRNRSLCDVFFGLRVMQRAGTGLLEAEDLLRGSGGAAEFKSNGGLSRFEAAVSGPAMSPGSKQVARDNRPMATYVLNSLPLVSVPASLSTVQLRQGFKDRPASLDLSDAGTFVVIGGDKLLTFVPLAIIGPLLGGTCDPAGCSERPLLEVVADGAGRDHVSWLLRKHFEQHLRGLRGAGLLLESELPGRRNQRRAFFVGDGKPLDLAYATPLGRRVKRQVVKGRSEPGRRAWFENEGFSYAVVADRGGWAIRVKPFYMFTGPDARTPLPSFLQGSRAVRRFKFDRNKNVDDDLTFWGRFIAEGQPVVNVGQVHVDDLLLQGSFLTVEVPVA